MIFWSSSEATNDANELFRPLRKIVELEINRSLSLLHLAPQWESWKWAFIAIIVSEEFDQDYPERVRQNTKQKVLEFRLKLGHNLFVNSAPVARVGIYFSQLKRSVGLMDRWKMTAEDQAALLALLDRVEVLLTKKQRNL